MKILVVTETSAQIRGITTDNGKSVPDAAAALGDGVVAGLEKALKASRFEGKAGQMLELQAPSGTDVELVVLVGLGEAAKRTDRTYEKAGASFLKKVQNAGLASAALHVDDADGAARTALGAKLASYRFDTYRTKQKPEQLPSLEQLDIVSSAEAASAYEALDAAAEGTFLARDLMNEPPNILHPETFAARIEELSSVGLEIEVLGEDEMEKLGMNALLGVGQGSIRESKMAIMKWNGGKAGDAPVALVGKGVCFDTGGISLKPGPQMEDMKGDMGGAAAVVGAMKTLALRKAKANVVGLVGLVENMPDGAAQRPGDIVTSMSGQTIEIQNTDAEGRLVLCDVLWYAQETFKPKVVVDLATLTGAIVIALGHHHAGVFSNDDELAAALYDAGQSEGEKTWRMPLGEPYDKLIDSKFADMRNIGGRAAGSATAAQFLQRFIKDGQKWAHIDIAGVAWVEGEKEPFDVSWASGYGPRLLDRLIKDTYEG